jgi:hypothetical protein
MSRFFPFLGYLLVSVLYTWPAVRLDPTILPTRQFDLYPVIWLLEEAPTTFPQMFHATSAWPYGESLARVDSYVLLWIGWLNNGFFSGHTLATFLLWGGPAINAAAAERCARKHLQISAPWSWLAGASFGFSGITACAALEGHVYQLLNPWLPLLLGSLWERSSVWQGVKAGIWFSLCLFTSAYLGICGVILLVIPLLRWGKEGLKTTVGVSLIALPTGAYYLYLFWLGGHWQSNMPFDPMLNLQSGSTTLLGLLSWFEPADTAWHSLVAPLSFSIFWLVLLAPFLVHSSPRFLGMLAICALLLSFGASIRGWPGGPGIVGPLSPLSSIPETAFFRFPIRLLWLYALCGGLVAALSAQALFQKLTPKAGHFFKHSLPVLVLLDLFGSTGMPFRLKNALATTPDAYFRAPEEQAILDLFGEMIGSSSGELLMRARGISCFYQAAHQRPILDVCIGTRTTSPREQVSRWLIPVLLKNPDPTVATRLASIGIGAVALHMDSLRPEDRMGLQHGLSEALGDVFITSYNGGEAISLYRVGLPVPDLKQQQSNMRFFQAY